ncbi:hypothetical protein EC988_006272, partial [Linderina pennispora]
MNGAGGNSTRLLFDDDDYPGSPMGSIVFAVIALAVILVLFKILYERCVTPLSAVPGQIVHSITSIPMRYHMIRGDLPEFLLKLHQKFGPIVRISPQRVSVADPDIIRHVLGSHTFRKTPSYEMPEGIEANAFSTQSPELSTHRRRQIGAAFSHRNLAGMQDKIFEATVLSVQEKLDAKLAEAADNKGQIVVNIYSWFSLISLDTIGILAFGRNFHALKNEMHELVPLLNRVRVLNYITMAFPWLKQIPRLVGWRLTTISK